MGGVDGLGRRGGTDHDLGLLLQPNHPAPTKPSPIDWFEDKLYTGLLFVAVALLAYDLLGKTLVP